MMESARLFTDAFDYNSRRTRRNLTGNEQAAQALIARLRLDALIFDRIVLADVQLLHSLFLSNLTMLPAIRGTVAQQLPLKSIEIRTRKRGIADTLVSLVRREGQSTLAGHLFTLIDPTGALVPELARQPASRVSHWRDIAPLLIDLKGGDDRELIEQSEAAWAFWIEAELSGHIQTRTWDKEFRYSDVIREFKTNEAIRSIATDFGKDVVHKLERSTITRGGLAALLLAQDAKQTLNDDEYAELELIDAHFGESYNQVVARQHDCALTDTNSLHPIYRRLRDGHNVFDSQTGEFRDDDLTKLSHATKVPHSFLVGLSRLPAETFSRLLEDMATRLFEWRAKSNQSELKLVAEGLQDLVVKFGLPANTTNSEMSSIVPVMRAFRYMSGGAIGTIGTSLAMYFGLGPAAPVVGGTASSAMAEAERAIRWVQATDQRTQIKSIIRYANDRIDQANMRKNDSPRTIYI